MRYDNRNRNSHATISAALDNTSVKCLDTGGPFGQLYDYAASVRM